MKLFLILFTTGLISNSALASNWYEYIVHKGLQAEDSAPIDEQIKVRLSYTKSYEPAHIGSYAMEVMGKAYIEIFGIKENILYAKVEQLDLSNFGHQISEYLITNFERDSTSDKYWTEVSSPNTRVILSSSERTYSQHKIALRIGYGVGSENNVQHKLIIQTEKQKMIFNIAPR